MRNSGIKVGKTPAAAAAEREIERCTAVLKFLNSKTEHPFFSALYALRLMKSILILSSSSAPGVSS